jgi:hypothetical protein
MMGRTAITLAVIALVGLVFITLFYTLNGGQSGPFGTLNDICVALGGVLSGILAWMIYPFNHSFASRASRLALLSAGCGAILAPLGSVLVIFDITGWFLAGLVTTFGYALIGLWLLILSNSMLHWPGFPRKLAQFGRIAGGVMAVGLLAVPGILARSDSTDTAQWFTLTALVVGGLGWNLLYTLWCIWVSRLLLSKNFT